MGCPAPDVDAEGDDPPTAATSSPAGMSIVTGPSKLVGMGSSGLKRLNKSKVNYGLAHNGSFSAASPGDKRWFECDLS